MADLNSTLTNSFTRVLERSISKCIEHDFHLGFDKIKTSYVLFDIAVMFFVYILTHWFDGHFAAIKQYTFDRITKWLSLCRRRKSNQLELCRRFVKNSPSCHKWEQNTRFSTNSVIFDRISAYVYHINKTPSIYRILDLKYYGGEFIFDSFDTITVVDENSVNFVSEVIQGDNEILKKITVSHDTMSMDELTDYIENIYNLVSKKEAESRKNSNSPFFYDLVAVQKSELDVDLPIFDGSAITSSKSFDNLFIEDKNDIIQLIDTFQNKTGIYAKSIPWRLNFLLTGPPGTGKTSFIKALAKYTERNIINVNLKKIKKNSVLRKILHDRMIFNSKYSSNLLELKDRIYILEDIDALDSIVLKRESQTKTSSETQKLTNAIKSLSSSSPKSSDTTTTTDNSEEVNDALSLAGLLNAVDGIIECTGAMIVMTTNHPERLDPALTRPGRISKQIHFGYMSPKCICEMVEYYCDSSLPNTVVKELDHLQVTPAELEGVCIEYLDVNHVAKWIETETAAQQQNKQF